QPLDWISAVPSLIFACPAPHRAVLHAAAHPEAAGRPPSLLLLLIGQGGMRRLTRRSTIFTGWERVSTLHGRSGPAAASSSSTPISAGRSSRRLSMVSANSGSTHVTLNT